MHGMYPKGSSHCTRIHRGFYHQRRCNIFRIPRTHGETDNNDKVLCKISVHHLYCFLWCGIWRACRSMPFWYYCIIVWSPIREPHVPDSYVPVRCLWKRLRSALVFAGSFCRSLYRLPSGCRITLSLPDKGWNRSSNRNLLYPGWSGWWSIL